jgi:hypothetical protein
VDLKLHIQVLFDVVQLEGVSTGVTRVSKYVKPLVFPMCMLPLLQFYLLNDISLCHL